MLKNVNVLSDSRVSKRDGKSFSSQLDWLGDIKLFSVRNSCMLLYDILSDILPAIGRKDIGR